MDDAASGSQNGTEETVATAAMSNLFALNRVLLGGKGQFDGGGRKQLRVRGHGEVKGMVAGIKGHIGEAERVGTTIRSDAVFAGPHQEEECEDEHVGDSAHGQGAIRQRMGQRGGLDQQPEGKRLDAARRRVLLGERFGKTRKTDVESTMVV